MPSVFMDKNSIRIELTQAEADSFGFASNRPQWIHKILKSDGGVRLELSSSASMQQPGSSEAVAWIPPVAISPGSCGCQERSTTKLVGAHVSKGSASYMEDFTRPYSSVSGHHPHGADWEQPAEETGDEISTCSLDGRESS